MEKLIWTYNSNIKVKSNNPSSVYYTENKNDSKRKNITINYYILSITNAKKLGYTCVIYTDNESSIYFENIVDELIVVSDYEESPLFDSFKFKVLEERDDEFCLIDGDLILHSKLPIFVNDIVFDSYETGSWSKVYSDTISTLDNLKITKSLSFWENEKTDIMCCGLLYFKNKKHRITYLNLWKEFNSFIKNHLTSVDLDFATAVGAQYLLTIMVKKLKLNNLNISNQLGVRNQYYHHHNGDLKYKKPIVPTDYILNNEDTLKLI